MSSSCGDVAVVWKNRINEAVINTVIRTNRHRFLYLAERRQKALPLKVAFASGQDWLMSFLTVRLTWALSARGFSRLGNYRGIFKCSFHISVIFSSQVQIQPFNLKGFHGAASITYHTGSHQKMSGNITQHLFRTREGRCI